MKRVAIGRYCLATGLAAGMCCLFAVDYAQADERRDRGLLIPDPTPKSQRSDEEIAVRTALKYWGEVSRTVWHHEAGQVRGWASRYTEDQRLRHGTAGQPIPADVVCIKDPGTLMMARTYLLAYLILGEPSHLQCAKEVGQLLVAGQTEAGGWGRELWMSRANVNTIRTGSGIRRWPASDPAGMVRGEDTADLDNNVTGDAMEFLYKLWWITDDERFGQAYRKALDFHLVAQTKSGGFPQTYPADDYRAQACQFGGATLAAVQSLQLGYERTGQKKYLEAVIRCADWLVSVRKPGQGWGMRYDEQGNLGGGRDFEPPGLSSESTLFAMMTLRIAYTCTADARYRDTVKDAADWLRQAPTAKGFTAKFYHPGTNRPWFRDGAGLDVRQPAKARRGYAWFGPWGQQGIELARQFAAVKLDRPRLVPEGGDPSTQALLVLQEDAPRGSKKSLTVEQVLASREPNGTWVVEIEGLRMLTVNATCRRIRILLAHLVEQRRSAEQRESAG